MYCSYCGRLARRCCCAKPDSDLQRFLGCGHESYTPQHRLNPYKRGVPPQIKKRERVKLRSNHKTWYAALISHYGSQCLNCGRRDDLVVDHVVPIAKGGISEPDNLQLLCASCNRLKGKLVIDCRSGTIS